MAGTKIMRFAYKKIVKPLLFKFDPENVHDAMTFAGALLGKTIIWRFAISALLKYKNNALEQHILGIRFTNPIGLSAGFDKNAKLLKILPCVGFGFAEIGSITARECEGNPRPRLMRMPNSKAILVNYGLRNEGCDKIIKRISKTKNFNIGISIARTNCKEASDLNNAIEDYASTLERFSNNASVSYFTINISCPNAFTGEMFMDTKNLDLLLTRIDKIPAEKPIFIKTASEISTDELDEIVNVAQKHRVHGFVLSNLVKNRQNPCVDKNEAACAQTGGISGAPTAELSLALISHMRKKYGNMFVVIASGGVFSAKDAYTRILAGASLVELITGMIYEGPQLIGEINRGLAKLLKRDGFANISEAVGKMH
ncbi:MAG: hypothetical protein ACD_76C00052G0004 [uncultured bacterium]|nr:MAG: hypothetical protein ACD_76C00052G0004 [uncultured bacterium]